MVVVSEDEKKNSQYCSKEDMTMTNFDLTPFLSVQILFRMYFLSVSMMK